MAKREVGIYFRAYNQVGPAAAAASRDVLSLNKTVVGLGSSLGGLAAGYVGIRAIGSTMVSAGREAMGFETTMAQVSTMLEGDQPHLMSTYAKGVRDLAKDFGEGTETLGKGLYDILSASVAPSKALGVLKASAMGAKAGLTTTAVSADYLTTVMNSYGKSADAAATIMDQGFAIVKRGKLEFGDLAGEVGKAASVAATADVPFEELGAGIATLTRAGLKPDIAITSLRGIISSFISPSKEASAAAAELGLTLDATTLSSIGLSGVLEKLKTATAEQLAQIVPEARAFTGLAAAVKNASGFMDDYRSIVNSAGAAQQAFNKIAATSEFKINTIRQRWTDVKRDFGDLALGKMIGPMEDFVRGLEMIDAAAKNAAASVKSFNEAMQSPGSMIPQLSPGRQFRRGSGNPFTDMLGTTGPVDLDAMELKEMNRRAAERFEQAAVDNAKIRAAATAERNAKWQQDYSSLGYIGKALEAPGQLMQKADPFVATWEYRLEKFQEEQESEKRIAADRAAAYRQIASDLDLRTTQSWTLRKGLLAEEYHDYGRFIKDKALLDQWYNEQREKMAIEESQATGTFLEGWGAGIEQMRRDLPTIGQLGAESAEGFRDAWAEGMTDVLMKTKSAKDMLRSLWEDFARMQVKSAMNSFSTIGMGIVSNMLGGWGSQGTPAGDINPAMADVAHGGGTVGTTAFPTRIVSSGLFDNAPRAHGGLRSDERAFILQTGEDVVSRQDKRRMRSTGQSDEGASAVSSARVEMLLGQLLAEMRLQGDRKMVVLDRRSRVSHEEVAGIIIDDLNHAGPVSTALGRA